jgi:PAS domain S-box-containing protein
MKPKGAAGISPGFPDDELLRAAVAHQRDAVLITEADRVAPVGRRIVFVNPAFTALTGFSSDEAVGQTPDLTIGRDSGRQAIRNIQAAIETKQPVRQEILKYRKDGSTFWAELDIAPVVEPSGHCRYFVCVMRDISEKKRDQELLERQAVKLEEASRAKSQFLANVSHELRTPLNAIISYTSNILEGVYGELADQQLKALRRLESNGRHLLTLINEVLDLSRIESGQMPLHASTFALDALVAEVLAELEPLISRSELSVTSRLSSLPPLRSDRQKVKQILLNLLSNAIKFTKKGWVRIETGESEQMIAISVSDSGVGIALQNQQKVFEDFWQVDSSPSRAQGGTGLGLSICRRLATLLNGRIVLKSAPGEGSSFTLLLPR